MDISIDVKNQRLRVKTNQKTIVDGTQDFIHFVFNLSDDWDDLTVYAQFAQDGNVYNVTLDDDNTVDLPEGITAGAFTLLIAGENDTIFATSDYVTFKNIESAYIG